MLRDGAGWVNVEVVGTNNKLVASTDDQQRWASADARTANDGLEGEDWRRIDRSLRRNAKLRATLDADDARLFREAERLQIWKPLGMVSMIDYLERVFGYSPRTAQQRLQVARALEHLPEMTEALAVGELPFSAVRELVRVATPKTEAAWRAHVGGMNLRQIEEAVAGHKLGDLPTDAPDIAHQTHRVVLELSDAVYALWRQAGLALDNAHGRHLDDEERASAMATAVLEHLQSRSDVAPATSAPATNATSSAPSVDPAHSGRARYQIALTVCRRCDQAWQVGGGIELPVDAATLARARCDAQHIGALDGDGPERAHQDIPPSVVRFVHRRDGERCQTPGCRSGLGLEIHHIVHREHGGTHDPSNLTLRCWSCHDAHHRGVLVISGTAPNAVVTTRLHAHVGNRFDEVALRTQARDALVGLGWKAAIASAAVDEARANGFAAAPIEVLVREALRRCPC
jgi:hypothetical protein